jgi:hypothetical protein
MDKVKSSGSEPIGNNEGRKEVWKISISPINVISPICFHFYNMGNGNNDISSEVHFKNFKAS